MLGASKSARHKQYDGRLAMERPEVAGACSPRVRCLRDACMVAAMKCAKCDGTLSEVKVGKIRVDRCDKCEGIWFDENEVIPLIRQPKEPGDTLVASNRPPESERIDQRAARCPRCSKPLKRTASLAVEGLHYDRCESCKGAWLDGGELEQILTEPGADAMLAFFNELD